FEFEGKPFQRCGMAITLDTVPLAIAKAAASSPTNKPSAAQRKIAKHS
ncbi:MAG: hypothetical protein JKX70_05595, partial [Phycisphaerales bacterium]|nr:hypothetical protein [Phycisphaerales bacterium]